MNIHTGKTEQWTVTLKLHPMPCLHLILIIAVLHKHNLSAP